MVVAFFERRRASREGLGRDLGAGDHIRLYARQPRSVQRDARFGKSFVRLSQFELRRGYVHARELGALEQRLGASDVGFQMAKPLMNSIGGLAGWF